MPTSVGNTPPDPPSDELYEKLEEAHKIMSVWDNTNVHSLSYLKFPNIDFKKLYEADASDIKSISISQLEMNAAYYNNPHKQSRQSFFLACAAAVICLVLFAGAITILIIQKPANIAYIATIGSAISAFFGGIFFLIYRQASNQALAYKPQVDKIQQFIMANSACETLSEERKQKKREEIIDWLLDLSKPTSEDKK